VEAAHRSALVSVIPTGPPLPRRSRPSTAASADSWLEIVGIVRDIGLDPDDDGNEDAAVFQPASAGEVVPLVMSVRTRANPATLVARLPVIAADVDPVMVRPGRAAAGPVVE
jgi:hypothetical protein